MRISEYIRSRGLRSAHVAQKAGMSRQGMEQFGNPKYGFNPTVKSLEKIAAAMTELGAPTTVVDLTAALYEGKTEG